MAKHFDIDSGLLAYYLAQKNRRCKTTAHKLAYRRRDGSYTLKRPWLVTLRVWWEALKEWGNTPIW